MTLMLVVLRRVNNTGYKGDNPVSRGFIERNAPELVRVLFEVPSQTEYDEEAAKYFLIIEEILLSLALVGYLNEAQNGMEFVDKFMNEVLQKFLTQEDLDVKMLSYVAGTVRLLLLLLQND